VQHDPDRAIGLLHERPGLIHSGGFAGSILKAHVAHGVGVAAVELNHLVGDLAGTPGLDGKAFVVREGRITTHEIGQGPSTGSPESLRSRRQGGLERHRPELIGIALIDHGLRGGLGLAEASTGIGGTDLQQTLAPALLGRDHFSLRDVAVEHLHRGGGLSLEAEAQGKNRSNLKKTGADHGGARAFPTPWAAQDARTTRAQNTVASVHLHHSNQ